MVNVDATQTRKPRLGATQGEWWRFSSYELRDGCICPTPESRIEWYDPWPGFHDTREQLKVGQLPHSAQPGYQSLLKLVHELEYVAGKKRYPECLSGNSQAAILGWCREHGLLGVLLSRWEAISLAPVGNEEHGWTQRRYFRGFGQTVQSHQLSGDVKDNPASALIHELNDLALIEALPNRTWSRFFPNVELHKQDTFQYPQPYTDEFCRSYGERLIDFCKAAKLLTGAMLHLGRTPPAIDGDPGLARQQALDVINMLRRPVASVLEFGERDSVHHRREAPSLLASFADMFAQDLAYGMPTLQCTACGVAFVSSSYQAQYCSVACRLRGQKRRLRAQMKEATALRAEGKSLRQIAKTVHQPIEIVKGWLERAKPKTDSGLRPV